MRIALGFSVVGISLLALTAVSPAGAQGLQPPPAAPPGFTPFAPAQTYPAQTYPVQSGYPGATTPSTSATQQQLDLSEKDDSGRGFEIGYARADVGGSYLAPKAISSSRLQSSAHEGGGLFGLAAGARILIFTVGARARLNVFSDFELWQMDLDLGWHLPIGKWDPYVSAHAGYDFKTGGTSGLYDGLSLHGFDTGLSVGTDYYLSSLFSLGADVTGDVLFLHESTDRVPVSALTAYPTSGISTGLGISGSIHAGLHFGL